MTRNAINWFEIPVADIDRAQRFYETLLARSLRREQAGPQTLAIFPYEVGSGVGGMLRLDAVPPAPSDVATLVYLDASPSLKVVMVESGFAWAPAFAWRLDKTWKALRAETPHLKRPPSEYLKERVWWTTQPMEEPEPRSHLLDTINWMGWDRLLFATDYPHWDFDDPSLALPLPITENQRLSFFRQNALSLYGVTA